MNKMRVDVLLVERGLAESRSQAQRLLMAGDVRVNGQVILKPSHAVTKDAEIVVDRGPAYVSRGGDKLAAALREFAVYVKNNVCADVGASTGGFTDCLLKHGAARVYAIDVGFGILHWKLRNDPRVVVMERTNARYLERLPEPVEFVTIDASFISLKNILPAVRGWFRTLPASPSDSTPVGSVIALVKPQFEAGRQIAARSDGVIRDAGVHRQVLHGVLSFSQAEGFAVKRLIQSPLLGSKGNVEFLALLAYPGAPREDLDAVINQAVDPGQTTQPNR